MLKRAYRNSLKRVINAEKLGLEAMFKKIYFYLRICYSCLTEKLLKIVEKGDLSRVFCIYLSTLAILNFLQGKISSTRAPGRQRVTWLDNLKEECNLNTREVFEAMLENRLKRLKLYLNFLQVNKISSQDVGDIELYFNHQPLLFDTHIKGVVKQIIRHIEFVMTSHSLCCIVA